MRDDRITIAKAIGIILMVVVHGGLAKAGADFVTMFHMPLFFVASGYCFKEKYLANNTDFVKRKAKGLYIPYVKYALLFLLLHNAFFHLGIYNASYGFKGEVSHLYPAKEYLLKALHIVTAMWDHEQLLGGYWFIKQLFLSSILSFFILKRWKEHLLPVLVCTMGACVLASRFNLRIPYWGVNSLTLLGAFFFIAGYYLRTRGAIPKSVRASLLCFVAVLAVSVYFPTSMLRFDYANAVPYSVAAVAGSLLTLHISGVLARSG